MRDAGVADIPLALSGEVGHAESDMFDNLLLWATANDGEEHDMHTRSCRPQTVRTLARILGEGVEKFEGRLSMPWLSDVAPHLTGPPASGCVAGGAVV